MSEKLTNPDPEAHGSDPAYQLPSLEARIAQLEQHVTQQDGEIYRLSRKVDTLVKVAQDQRAQLVALAEMGSSGVDDMPADEKPPHY